MKFTKKSDDTSEEEFDKLMNTPLSKEQLKAAQLRKDFMDKMMTPMKIVIMDVYGKNITPNIEEALERFGQVVYLECTD